MKFYCHQFKTYIPSYSSLTNSLTSFVLLYGSYFGKQFYDQLFRLSILCSLHHGTGPVANYLPSSTIYTKVTFVYTRKCVFEVSRDAV